MRPQHIFAFGYIRTPFHIPANNFLFKVNNRFARTRCERQAKPIIETPEQLYRRQSGVFITNDERHAKPCPSTLTADFNQAIGC